MSRDFIERAAAYKLDYLCEADLFAAVPPTLDAAIRDRVTAFTGADRSAAEQDIDFLTGRLFRRSVLVRSRPPAATRPPRPGSAEISACQQPAPARSGGNATPIPRYSLDDRGAPGHHSRSGDRQAIARLADAYPGTLALDELGCRRTSAGQVAERIRRAVFAMVMAGRASISVAAAVGGAGG